MTSRLLLPLTALLASAGLAHAQTLVFDSLTARAAGGNLAANGTATNSVDLGLGTPGANDSLEVRAFNTATPMWTDATNTITPSLFGGFSAGTGDPVFLGSTDMAWIMRNGNAVPPVVANNQLRVQASGLAGQNGSRFQGAVFAPVSSLNTADLGAIFVRSNGGNPVGAYHAVVRSGSSFFVSSTNLAAPGGAFDVTPGADNSAFELFAPVGTATWQAWDFTANAGDNFAVTFTSLGMLPSVIDGIGYYFTGEHLADTPEDTLNVQNNIIAFGFTAVPESSAAGLLAGLAAAGFIASRRRR